MNQTEHRYLYWKFIEHYVLTKGFRLLALHDTQAWVEDDAVKPRRVIRLVLTEVDWSNRLKRDISHAQQQFDSIFKQLGVWKMQGENIYVMSQPPIDSWEDALVPFQVKKNKGTIRNLALHTNITQYQSTIDEALPNDQIPTIAVLSSDEEMEAEIDQIRKKVKQENGNRRKKEENTLFYGKPRFIYALLISFVVMFFLLETNGGSTNIQVLIEYGAKYNPLIMEGEWWRLVTSMFLHIGLLHLFFNAIALFFLGTAVEQLFGTFRFVIIYFLAGIFGSIVSFAFNDYVSAGASGALFGCFGALLYFGMKHPTLFFRTLGKNILFLLGFNLVLGFIVPGIDNGAHIGGLLGGFLIAAFVRMPKEKKPTPFLYSITAFIVYGIAALALLYFGQQSTSTSPELAVLEAQRLFEEENYEEAQAYISAGLQENDRQPQLLFMQAYVDVRDDNLEEAQMNLELALEEQEEFPEAWFNLTLIYLENEEYERAQDTISEAIDYGEALQIENMDQYYEIEEQILSEID
ncbi:rhomboid family intramembrane serine protease [Alkalihalobacillus sp. LMS6]|uniref:rhomboid family protein n=1 Tax=Alkalihalobacillus sp. LMS6 TaxID=2924034 RepID=UPI0020D0181F|nr:rhomboid family intramembrane serine protease [Alkalihalobacillus sp. LMS6]UTR07986.1 rhomboid family intramembrane serine protease [Alkalihalobacillus sp. LMS6]